MRKIVQKAFDNDKKNNKSILMCIDFLYYCINTNIELTFIELIQKQAC